VGYLKRVNLQEKGLENAGIILQVSKINPMPNGKFGLVIHDCEHEMKAILNSSINALVQSGKVIVGTVIQVTRHNVNTIKDENMMIIHEMVVLQKDCEHLTENPLTMVPKPKPAQSGAFGNSGFGNNAFGRKAFGSNSFGKSSAFGNNAGFGAKKRPASSRSEFFPLKGINPFMREFTIKARVTYKGGVRTWKNASSEGKLFSINLIDSEGTEIVGTAFNDAVDTLFPIFEKGKVFVIKKARAKMSRRQYTHIPHQYCLDLGDAEVTLCEDDGAIDKFKFEFKPIGDIASIESGQYVDVIGVCQKVTEISNFTSKKGNELTKRTFFLVDQSSSNIECTLWGEEAKKFQAENEGKVVCLQAAKVSDFGGRTLTVNSHSVELDIPEVKEIKKWWIQNQKSLSITSLTQSRSSAGSGPSITLSEANLLGQNQDTPDYFSANVTFTQLFVKPDRNPWYNACPSEPDPVTQKNCLKKVVEGSEGEGTWYCVSCAKNFNNYNPRYIMKAKIADHTGSLFVGLFDKDCTSILSKTASEAEKLKEEDLVAYNNIFTEPVSKRYQARIRAKQETYNDEIRTRFDVVGLEAMDCKADMNRMYKEIQELLAK